MKYSIVIASVLTTLAAAASQTSSQPPAGTAKAVAEIVSYFSALATDPAVVSVIAVLSTDKAALSSFESAESSLLKEIIQLKTPASDFATAFPTAARSLVSSIVAAEYSILSVHGFVANAASTGAANASATSSGAAGNSTSSGGKASNDAGPLQGKFLGVSAVVVAGVLGGIMVL